MRIRPPSPPPKGPMGTGKPIGPKGVAPPRPRSMGPKEPMVYTPRPLPPENILPPRPKTPQPNLTPDLPGAQAMFESRMQGMRGMKKGGKVKKMAGGGLAPGHKSADGIAKKGKTKGTKVSMGGHTGMKKGGMTKMKKGGYC